MGKAELNQEIEKALQNATLKGALGRFGDAYVKAREKAYEGKDFQVLRQKVAEIKREAADNLEEMIEEFTLQATRLGAVVYRAKDAEDARRYIRELAQARQVKSIVKSKSMASEEIHLNEDLVKAGFEVYETDLGEWIIQLAGQRPSHMVMPAIHLTKEEVAEVFSKEVNERLASDIPRLVKTARKALRNRFVEADMGISGANIAVAETGTLVLVTNEGNARLTTTLPPIHVALVGIEKFVPKFRDVGPILETLPRSATAQTLTSYVTMITGPVPTIVNGEEKQKELHIVLLDNGRTQMNNDPVFREAFQCIRCASCLNVCPVYLLVGGHVYGHIYAGGIGTILTAFLNNPDAAGDIQALCMGCERCKDFCPGKVDIPKLLLELRTRAIQKKGLPFAQKAILEGVLTNRKLFHTMLRAASVAQKPVTGGQSFIRHLPLFLAGLTEGRSLPAVAEKPFRDIAPRIQQQVPKVKGKVAFYGGCLVDFVYPRIGEAVYQVLNKLGFAVDYPQDQTCCGAPAKYLGAPDTAVKLAKQNIAALEKSGARYIVTPCPTCTGTLKETFPHLLEGDPEWHQRALTLAAKVRDFSQFVHEQAPGGGLSLALPEEMKVTYHDSCHLKRKLGIHREPRELLQKAGANLVEMEDADRCCGFAGSYSVKFPQLSKPILHHKINKIKDTGAEVVAMDCPGCLLQIGGGLDQQLPQVKAQHTAEILAAALNSAKK